MRRMRLRFLIIVFNNHFDNMVCAKKKKRNSLFQGEGIVRVPV